MKRSGLTAVFMLLLALGIFTACSSSPAGGSSGGGSSGSSISSSSASSGSSSSVNSAGSSSVYTVTYDGNGNSGGLAPSDTNRYLAGQTVTVLSNTGNLAKSHFIFTNWNTRSDASGTVYNPGQKFTMGSSNLTLYASWNPTYTVTYYSTGSESGSAPSDPAIYRQGQNVTVFGNTGSLYKNGFGFDYWTNSNGSSYFTGQSYPISANLNLYPVWSIYTAGYDHQKRACYWFGTNETILDYTGGGSVNAIFVTNGVVYTAGMDDIGNVCFWTGTTKTNLDSSGYAYCIYVYNGVVYTGGNDHSGHPCFWAAKSETNLDSSATGSVCSIYIANNIIYAGGYDSSGAGEAAVWSNSVLIVGNTGFGSSMAVSGGIFYLAGCDWSTGDSCYWVDSTMHLLGASPSTATSIYAYNGAVYTAGRDSAMDACYWSASTPATLDTATSIANSIYVNGGTIYTAGMDRFTNACYWMGTKKAVLDSLGSSANAIY